MAGERDLLVIVPTRSRPDALRRLFDAVRSTCAGDPQILACLDADDAHNYEPIQGVWYLIKDRQRFVAWTNEAARRFADDFRFHCFMGDDTVPRTKGWDAAVAETLEGLGTAVDRIRYLPDVVIEHLHWSAGKQESDAPYEESHARMEPDRLAFEGYRRDGFDEDVAKMRAYLEGKDPSGELVVERAARQATERELSAIRRTRSYRWTDPARRVRALGRR